MIKRILCAAIVAACLAWTGPTAEGATRPSEMESCIQGLFSQEPAERLRAVRALSGLALDPETRGQARDLLMLARNDSEWDIGLQAEIALTTLTGGDLQAMRALYGVSPPDARELAGVVRRGRNPDERFTALVALGRWHGAEELDTLLAASLDPSPSVRHLAIEFLREIAADGGEDPRLAAAVERAAETARE